MHTIIANQCTGCKLCLPVCPTDCIDLIPAPLPGVSVPSSLWPAFSQPQVDKARQNTEQRIARAARKVTEHQAHKQEKRRSALKQEIQAVLKRKRNSRENPE